MIDNQFADVGKKVTCDDCIHCKACKDLRDDILSLFETSFKRKIEYEEFNQAQYCDNFKARSSVADIPCKIGDVVWCICRKPRINSNFYIRRGVVRDIYFNSEMKLIIRVHKVATGTIGNTIFYTKEQAEQALREQRNEET